MIWTHCILYYSDSSVTLSNVNLGRTALEWLSKAVLLENLKQPDELLDQLFFSGGFSDSPKPKEIYTWFFCRFASKCSMYLFRFSSFVCGLDEVLESLLEGSYKLWECVSHRVSSVNIAGKVVLPLCHLPWWNGSFIRGKWWGKSVLGQPTFSQLLIIYEIGERSTKG